MRIAFQVLFHYDCLFYRPLASKTETWRCNGWAMLVAGGFGLSAFSRSSNAQSKRVYPAASLEEEEQNTDQVTRTDLFKLYAARSLHANQVHSSVLSYRDARPDSQCHEFVISSGFSSLDPRHTPAVFRNLAVHSFDVPYSLCRGCGAPPRLAPCRA